MGYPWGISGPDFLALYVAALIVVVGVAVLARIKVRRPPSAPPAQRVGLPELAFLAGGPRRVVETAVSALLESGSLRPTRDGRLNAIAHTVGDTPGRDAVERAVLREIGAKPRSVFRVLSKASGSAAVTKIG